jgi:uncharacterized membrane protein
METPVTPPDLPEAVPAAIKLGLINSIQSRIISGLVLALPIALTFWIIYWLYGTLKQLVLDPIVRLVRYLLIAEGFKKPLVTDATAEFWLNQIVAPAVAMVLVLMILYFLGLFVRSRLHLAVDWVMFRVPGVTIIYKGLRNVFDSLAEQLQQGPKAQRVVLVEFPHPGARSLAFVTNTLTDTATGRTILSVCVLTGVMPPAGFTLFVPEESVTEIDWSMNQAIQAIVSGGITAPSSIHYFQGHVPSGGHGPIVDAAGQPIERLESP